jgi:hypothetical protein
MIVPSGTDRRSGSCDGGEPTPQIPGLNTSAKVLAADSEFAFPKRRRDHGRLVAHVGLDTLNVAKVRFPEAICL